MRGLFCFIRVVRLKPDTTARGTWLAPSFRDGEVHMGIFDKQSSAGLREKYNHAIQTAKSLHMQGGAEERDGKLLLQRHRQLR